MSSIIGESEYHANEHEAGGDDPVTVATALLANSAVTREKMAADSVGAEEILADAIDTSKIQDAAVTGAKLDTETVQDFVGGMVGSNLSYDDTNGQLDATGGDTSYAGPDDITANRSLNTQYENTTGNATEHYVQIEYSGVSGGSKYGAEAIVNGVQVHHTDVYNGSDSNTLVETVNFCVPDGVTYEVGQLHLANSAVSVQTWARYEIQ